MNYDRTFLNFISELFIIFGMIALAHPAQAKSQVTFGVPELNCRDDGQISLNRCAVYWSKTTDFLQSQVYQDEMIVLSQRYRSRFEIAERDWRRYRQAHCQEVISPFVGGSMVPMLYHRCLAIVTNDRIADLQGLAPPSDVSAGDPIQSLITELQQNDVQQIWNRYQAEYCQFESQYFSQSTRRQSCVTRLSQNRLRHLKIMMDSR
jgi:uncharacterized protein YecT (DUF1311 family)